MSKKLFARIASVVLSIVMLSTCALASTATVTYDIDGAIDFGAGYTSSEEYVTMMAFLVDDGTTAENLTYSNQTIVAIEQAEGATGFTSIPVDTAKIAEGKDIAVLVGGSDGKVQAFVLDAAEEVVPTTYTVTFDANGGAFADATATKVFEEVAENTTLADVLGAIAAPAKAEDETNTYAFAGWFTAAEGGEPVDLATAVAADVTVYAQYTATAKPVEPQTVTVTLNGNGGLFGADATLAVEVAANATFADVLASATYVEPVKAKSGNKTYQFVAWYTEAACETAVDMTATVSATTLYAKFVQVADIGDITGDGLVNAADIAAIKVFMNTKAHPQFRVAEVIDYYYGTNTKGGVVYCRRGDVNFDKNVNAADIAAIKVFMNTKTHPTFKVDQAATFSLTDISTAETN